MAELNTLARPYAQAAFDVARESGNFDDWEGALDTLASVVSDERVSEVLNNPKVAVKDREKLLLDFCGDTAISGQIRNLARTMFENNRLSVLPNVASQFKTLRGEIEKTIVAEVVTASKLSKTSENALKKALKKRFGSEVTLNCQVDKNIIGGGIVRVDDWVMDGSVATQLSRLETALAN